MTTPPFGVLLCLSLASFLEYVVVLSEQIYECYGLSVCVLPNLNVEIPISNVMILIGGGHQEVVEYSVFMNGIMKIPQRSLSPISPGEDTVRRQWGT